MDIQTMKHIDRFVGNPLCGALRLYDLVRHGRAEYADTADPDFPEEALREGRRPRIGVMKFWGMGSLILAAPLFKAIRKTHPEAEIHFLTLSQNRQIAELLELADQVHTLTLPPGPAGVAAAILSFIRKVQRLRLDAVIDLEYLTRFSAFVCYLSGAKVRIGFHSWDAWRGRLHTVQRAFNPYWHVTDNFLNLHAALGRGSAEKERPALKLQGAEDEAAARLLAQAGISQGERVIAVNPNASTMALERRWPEDHFVALIDRICEAGLGRVVLIGSREEAPYVDSLKQRLENPDRAVNLAGRSSLSELVGILRRAELLVTNDSGPLHLADALGCRTVSFFGPETPALFGPLGEGHIILYRGIDCSPCINIYNAKTVQCMRKEPECLSRISVDEAFAAVEKALEDGA